MQITITREVLEGLINKGVDTYLEGRKTGTPSIHDCIMKEIDLHIAFTDPDVEFANELSRGE